jgi:hypothetical protein
MSGLLSIAILIFGSFGARAEVQPSKQETSEASRAAKEILQEWIAQDMHFFVDRQGAAKLFLRRQPVKAALSLGSLPVKDEVVYLIDRLSRAAGVPYELTSREVNLAIVVDSPINEGDKPNPELWKRMGLSEAMYNIVSSEPGKWASGCGIYSFGNAANGEVGLSITVADSKLEPARLKDCVIDGTIRAFGLRSQRKLVLRSDDGYLQFVDLARAMSACERLIGSERLASMKENEQKSQYLECASDFLEK